jgi:hypothetical protein
MIGRFPLKVVSVMLEEDKLYALASSVSGWFKPSMNPDRMRFLMVAIRKDYGANKK